MAKQNIKFEDLVNQLQVGIFRCTIGKNTKIVYANSALLGMLGLKIKEISKVSVRNLFADQRKFQNLMKRVVAERVVSGFEARLKDKLQKSVWCALFASAVSENGEVKYVDVVVEDKTEQKSYEKELIESKELFQTVFNKTAAAITVTDKNEKIVAWNPFAEKLLAMDKKDLFNKPVKDLYPAKEWQRIRGLRLRQKGTISDIETLIHKKDGSPLEVHLSISILKDLDGNIMGSIGIIRDITSQKMAERKIKEDENKIRVILDNSAAAITLTDEEERIVSWNRYTEHLLGMKKDDLYLRPVKTLYPDEEWSKIRSEKIRKMGSKHHLETKVVDKKGNIIPVDLSINVLRDSNNKIVGSVGILQDITEQKRFQEVLVQAKLSAEEANSAKSLFLANMSHEVRTPMNAIMGMIDLTLDTNLEKEQKENLLVAKDAADNLLGLLNDILDLSRVEAGKISLENIEFHLPNVVRSVVKGLSVIAHKKSLNLVANIHPKVPELVLGDPVRLRQILVNLINNAIKFTHKGDIIVEVQEAQPKDSEGKVSLLFSVSDQGIGIPKDKHETIFEIFTQADSSTSRRFGGTGLGLAICKRLVEMMDGRIWVESVEGKGSTFNFLIKSQAVISQKPSGVFLGQEAGPVSEERLKEQLKNLKILLADDNLVNQKITSRMLEKEGCMVEAVVNGKEVVEKLHNKDFDVVLMDAQMPVLDGFEATKIIRDNERSTGKHIPIIALTARAMHDDRQKCIDAGMDGYVAKPIDRKKLFEEITNTINKGT